jgi:hypothetical protein
MLVADNYSDFAEYVIMLLKDIEFRHWIGKNGLLLAKTFDHKHAAEKLNEVLKECKKKF